MSEPVEPGKVQPTYSGFVILRINEIWSVWRAGDPVGALTLALRFASTMTPKKIKRKLKHDVEVIRKDMDKAGRVQGGSFYGDLINKSSEEQKRARVLIGPFLDKLSDLLDEWGYYEIPQRRLKATDFKEIEKNEG